MRRKRGDPETSAYKSGAKNIVLPVSAFSSTAASLCRPKRTCFQQHVPRDASILVADVASRTCTRSLPIQLSLAQA